jgi:hypothetical protein
VTRVSRISNLRCFAFRSMAFLELAGLAYGCKLFCFDRAPRRTADVADELFGDMDKDVVNLRGRSYLI